MAGVSSGKQIRMVELPYHRESSEVPDIDVDDLVQYFNLEFGIDDSGPSENAFKSGDFSYIGIRKIDGYEMMLWRVDKCQVHASVQPFEDGYITGMVSNDDVPS